MVYCKSFLFSPWEWFVYWEGGVSFFSCRFFGSSFCWTSLGLEGRSQLPIGSPRGKEMQRASFLAILWVLCTERNDWYYGGKVTSVDCVSEKMKCSVASWMLVFPHFQFFSIDQIYLNWREVAFDSKEEWWWLDSFSLCCLWLFCGLAFFSCLFGPCAFAGLRLFRGGV